MSAADEGLAVLAALRRGELAGTRRLDLSCGLTEFPLEIFALADSLEVLNLSGNALQTLPDDLHRLHRLRVLFCSDNRFTELPAALGRCRQLDMVGFKANRIRHVPAAALPPQLRWLILTDNAIDALPDVLGHSAHLQKLMLAGNRLQRLPDDLAGCHRLELLRIAANDFAALPPGLLRLPRLAWLAFGGNPLGRTREAAASAHHAAPDIDWASLTVGACVGEGASGVIHRAEWADGSGLPRAVAVKLFKGAITSDGAPQSELAAGLAAGAHPHRIAVEGRVVHHPEGVEGLVMQWVEPDFAVLAGPPSLASCTRDVYAEGLRFTATQALQLARGIAAAVAQLHARGIVHGDLYAHNILWRTNGDALLGDFGAASFFDPADVRTATALSALEARAFGCLLEELHSRCAVADADRLAPLAALEARCLDPDASARPGFEEIVAALPG